jgi:hypothetical protein
MPMPIPIPMPVDNLFPELPVPTAQQPREAHPILAAPRPRREYSEISYASRPASRANKSAGYSPSARFSRSSISLTTSSIETASSAASTAAAAAAGSSVTASMELSVSA